MNEPIEPDPFPCLICEAPATEDSDFCISCKVKAESKEDDEPASSDVGAL